jgi:membrane-bound serine protease (ClpP class)
MNTPRHRHWLRALVVLVALLSSRPALAAENFVRIRIDGVINPIKVANVKSGLERARAERAQFLLVEIDTPGGLVVSMQEIVTALTNTPVPVVAFVEPRSAQASSAGAFILLAADIAAMAPGTRVGAAHPVALGKALDDVLDKKATSSLGSLIRSLATRRGRPGALAEAMVKESTSFSAEEARDQGLIELLAVNQAELFQKLDGRELRPGRRLHTRDLTRIDVLPSLLYRVLDRVSDPTLTALFISLGTLGILYELSSPGIGAGGALGAILLVLGLLGSSVLPIETSAIALLVIGVVAIGLELKLPTHGVLGGSGVIAFGLGGVLLVDPSKYFGGAGAVNAKALLPIVLAAALGLFFLVRVTRKALSAPPETGKEALVGKRGTARSNFGTRINPSTGQIFVDGARWQAETEDAEIHAGDAVEVVAFSEKPMRLMVRRVL